MTPSSSEWYRNLKEFLMAAHPDAEKILVWESVLRSEFPALLDRLSFLWEVETMEFNWLLLDKPGYFSACTPEELRAYRRGAVMLAKTIRFVIAASLKVDPTDMAGALNERRAVQERARKILCPEAVGDPTRRTGG